MPASCTKLGPKRAFDELGTWAAVKAAIAADANVQEEWDLATEIRRAARKRPGLTGPASALAFSHLTPLG